ncbi:SusC/RagA family TonB-linked outer membrane protein [Saccharicrinis sp. FJH2]|uniref:SusC/RagA family TonB-linked outer membrane protein n=1 Tax=Saccharicrinis sp. FJH65 TaxID=3344659 RepID=UPI0035F43A14
MKKILLISGLLIIALAGGLLNAQAQTTIIKGQVVDAETKEPLVGVNVVEIDENERFLTGAITDMNGNYVIQTGDPDNPLQFSYIGYEKQTIPVNGKTTINVELGTSSTALNEVSVSGSRMSNDGITTIRDRTTSVSRLEFKELETQMGSSVEDMLQGRIANVDITSVSGDPGAGLNIRIRGTATLNARNTPLIVVNGIPYNSQIDENFDFATADIEKFGNMIDVAPEDIESIEVLKDAASTAIWGSSAANGVLMIKTKRGIKSKPIFDYTYKYAVGWEPDPLPMLNGGDYSRLIQQMHYNVDRNEFSNQFNPLVDNNLANEIAFDPRWSQYYNFIQETDWVGEITQRANSQQHVFSVRGGGDKSRYNMSVGHSNETGTTINNGLKKLTLRSSLDYDLSSKLTFKTDILYTRYDQYNTYDAEDPEFGSKLIRSIAYRKMPNMSVYDRDENNEHVGDYFTPAETLQGNARDMYNPVALANLGVNEQLKNNARALFTLRYRIQNNLILNSTITLDIFDNKRHRFLPYDAVGYIYDSEITNLASDEFSKKSTIYTYNQLIYTPVLGEDHSLTVMGQVDTEKTNQLWQKQQTSRSASPYLQLPAGDKTIEYIGQNFSEYRSLGFYLQGAYKYKDKYLATMGAKYEGNSKYSPDSRWGLFPTVSGAWRINEESFMEDATWINDFRLRVSWGQSGNSPNTNYLYWNTYNSSAQLSYLNYQGVEPNGVELTSLRWETLETFNPGISFYGLRNRLNVELDYYTKVTKDLFLENTAIPTHTGFTSMSINEGQMENRGYEVMVDYKILEKTAFKLSVNANFSTNKNIVISLPENFAMEYGDMLANGNYKISVVPGEPLGGFFGYRYLGVYQSNEDAVVRDENGDPIYGLNKTEPLKMIMGGSEGYTFEGGDAKYDDINHDGKIDELDLVYLGDLNPKVMGGTGIRAQYKNITFNTFLYFKLGQKVINQTRMDTEKMYNYDNQSKATNWYWRNPGDITDVPRPLYNKGYNWLGSSRFVEDGSYMRLKTISLSYDFSSVLLKKLHLRSLRVYATGYNLFTLTNYSGQDPEVGLPNRPDTLPKDYSRTPPSKRVMLGLNVSF